jgi:hypothetical protein
MKTNDLKPSVCVFEGIAQLASTAELITSPLQVISKKIHPSLI